MSGATRLGLGLMGTAAVLGVLGDLLLRPLPLGINVAVWTLCFAGCVAGIAAWQARPLGATRWLLGLAVVFALLIAWRSSLVLLGLDLLAVIAVLALTPVGVSLRRLASADLMTLGMNLARAGVYLGTGPLLAAINTIQWPEVHGAARLQAALPALRGVLLTLPLMLLFGGLFTAADASFEQLIASLFAWDLKELVVHVAVVVVGASLSAGGLSYLLLADDRTMLLGDAIGVVKLGIVEIGMALAALDALFLAFVAVQAHYLFGGALTVAASEALSYSEYARRGFFELVLVAALVLPLLLAADWALVRQRRRDTIVFRLLAGLLVALVFVVMASAVQRMLLYQSEYGLTELRVYPTAFMGWLAVVLLLFVGTVLRGQPRPFAFAAFGSGLLAIVALHILNPDDLIVRTNAARPNFDAFYASRLGAGAVPALLASLPQLNEPDRAVVAGCLLHRWGDAAGPDWRTWNAARASARALVQANAAELRGHTSGGAAGVGGGSAGCSPGYQTPGGGRERSRR